VTESARVSIRSLTTESARLLREPLLLGLLLALSEFPLQPFDRLGLDLLLAFQPRSGLALHLLPLLIDQLSESAREASEPFVRFGRIEQDLLAVVEETEVASGYLLH